MSERVSTINSCATERCGCRVNLIPHFDAAKKLYFLCPACAAILSQLKARAAAAGIRL